MGEININGFKGMNNLDPSFYGGKGGIVSPNLILNADVDDSGTINKRAGFILYLSLAGAHSLWACESCMLCAAPGKLYNLTSGAAVQVATVAGPATEPLSYSLCEDKVYVSNNYWRGVFDPSTGTVSEWGISLPTSPILITADGGLDAGTYHVCFTAVSGSEISGNGPISRIELTATGGIQILNRPSGALVWATDQNGYVFTLVGATNKIVEIPTVEPMPSFMCAPPQNMTSLTYAFGRMWGAVGPELIYSEPHRPGWFKITSNRFKFDSDINTIARVSTGLFIGMDSETVFLSGTEPDQMQQMSAGAGSVKGTLVYCNNVPYLADVLGTPEKVFVDVPVWRTLDGIVAGNASGRLFNLTKDKLKMGSIDKGASLYRNLNGAFQFLTSSGLGSGLVDPDAVAAFKAGAIPANNITRTVPTSNIGLSENVSCEQWRNGVLITD